MTKTTRPSPQQLAEYLAMRRQTNQPPPAPDQIREHLNWHMERQTPPSELHIPRAIDVPEIDADAPGEVVGQLEYNLAQHVLREAKEVE